MKVAEFCFVNFWFDDNRIAETSAHYCPSGNIFYFNNIF